MAELANAKIPDAQVPNRPGALTTVFHRFRPVDLLLSAGTISVGDLITLMSLPKAARVTWATVRTTGTMTSSGTPSLTLIYSRNSVGASLTGSFTVSAGANVALMTTAALSKDTTNSTVILLSVAAGSLDRTISDQFIETMVQYEDDDS